MHGNAPVRPWLWFPLLLGLLHFATELACSHTLTGLLASDALSPAVLLLYNALAFCLQPLAGWLVDRHQCPRQTCVAGGVLVLLGCLLAPYAPGPAAALLGLGNACLHVGAGSLCLSLARGRATALGLLVGPGAFGLVLGKQLADWQTPAASLVPWLVVGLALITLRLRLPASAAAVRESVSKPSILAPGPAYGAAFTAALVLPCVALRSLVGTGLSFPWAEAPALALAAGLALCLGKIAGGLLADRLGWLVTCMGAWLLSAPLLALGGNFPSCGLAGIALFQMPMAVTLALVAQAFPSRPAFSFGLASAAVFAGAYINILDTAARLTTPEALALMACTAMALLWLALRRARLSSSA